MRPCPAKLRVAAALVLVALGSAGRDARAQAWVDEQGALSVNLDYNLGISDKVVSDGVSFANAGTTSHQLTLAAEYVPLRRLAVNVSLPVVMLKYTGSPTGFEHPGGGSYDDGKYHTTLTDLRAGARYQVLEEPIALGLHLAGSIPVADYETVGNTVAGRGIKMLHAGLGVGRVFGAATYVHLLYEFSLGEKYDANASTEKYSQNRSDVSFTIGHKLLDQRLDLRAEAALRLTHDGVSLANYTMLPTEERDFHDPILKEDMLLVGAGVGYQISNALGVSLAARYFAWGLETQNASVLALGLTWSPL
jgi:hypothetical protein